METIIRWRIYSEERPRTPPPSRLRRLRFLPGIF
jgi:hypothetical protein